jgi:hypothetical protein
MALTPQQAKRLARSDRWQVFGALSTEAYAALKDDIAHHGVVVPIEVDAAGAVIDGHHRLRAVDELRAAGVQLPDPPVIVRPDLHEGTTLTMRYSVLARSDPEILVARELVGRLAGVSPPASGPTLLTVAEASKLVLRHHR